MEQLLILGQIFELIGIENVVALSLAALFCHAVAKRVPKHREANRKRNRDYALHEMDAMSDAHFKSMQVNSARLWR